MDDNNDLMIVKHLEGWIAHLQARLSYPKNSWQRIENLKHELDDAQKRLEAVSKLGRRNSRSYSRSYNSRLIEQKSGSPSRPFKAAREVSYR